VSYPLRSAFSSLWREKWINFLCVLTIASGLFLITMAYIFVSNLSSATRELPERFSVMVFLDDALSAEGSQEAVKRVRDLREVKAAKYISREEALRELKTAMEDSDYVLAGLEENPLPASIELKLREYAVTEGRVRRLAAEIKRIEGVEEVQYGAKLLSIIQSVSRYAGAAGLVLITVLTAGVVFVCYSTVKILFYRKQEEIETLKLLGATKGFIRSPFLIEGGVIGLASGALSSAGMLGLYFLLYARLAESFPLLKALSAPAGLVLLSPMAGLALGVAGTLIAIGRIRF
jgi:cell division transport system permease protein